MMTVLTITWVVVVVAQVVLAMHLMIFKAKQQALIVAALAQPVILLEKFYTGVAVVVVAHTLMTQAAATAV
jgi:hypothetical protein